MRDDCILGRVAVLVVEALAAAAAASSATAPQREDDKGNEEIQFRTAEEMCTYSFLTLWQRCALR